MPLEIEVSEIFSELAQPAANTVHINGDGVETQVVAIHGTRNREERQTVDGVEIVATQVISVAVSALATVHPTDTFRIRGELFAVEDVQKPAGGMYVIRLVRHAQNTYAGEGYRP